MATRRLIAFVAIAVVLPHVSRGADLEAGKRLYREGIQADGRPLAARVSNDVVLQGPFVACAKCHRLSGCGAREGARLVPPITGESLFAPQSPRRVELFRNLYQEQHPADTKAKVQSGRWRPAYTQESLVRVLREGVDARGDALDPLMPRYELGQRDETNLVAYLRTLSAENDAGVDSEVIHFATIVTDEVDTARRRAMLDVLHTYCDCHNLEVARYRAPPSASPHYKDLFIPTLRRWKLHVWKLRGDAESWPRQLSALYESTPVFALLGGVSDRPWRPIHQFCEDHELPCLFPLTDLPHVDAPNLYTVYFNRGLMGEAESLAGRVRSLLADSADAADETQVVQIYHGGETSEWMAKRFRATLAAPHGVLRDVVLQRGPPGTPATDGPAKSSLGFDPAALDQAAHVVVWLDPTDSSILLKTLRGERGLDPLAKQFYFSGTRLGASPQIDVTLPAGSQFTYPYALPGQQSRDVFRVRHWLQSRRIAANAHERIQLNSYYTCNLVKHALRHVVGHFHRDYFLEWIEHEAESALNPGVFAELSLGPGQRFASPGIPILGVSN